MPALNIDGVAVSFERGETILQAAARAGVAIPSLCSYPGIEPPTSCFVCVVKVRGKSTLTPSCATLAEEGMDVDSSSEEVRAYRRKALELLMSEHAGDCEAPCHRICPAGLDIPEMTEAIVAGDVEGASRTVWDRLALPGVLGHVCPAPCQKGCIRAHGDGPVEIRALHRGVAEAAFDSGKALRLCAAPSTGKRVAVIGAGPAGLSCVFYLALNGHACAVIDEREEIGGLLRYGADRSALPLAVLEREVALIRALGVDFRSGCRVSEQRELAELLQRFDAVVFATGARSTEQPWPFSLEATAKGIVTDGHTLATSIGGVFACGGAVAPCRMAVRAVGQGRLAALSVQRFLKSGATGRSPAEDPSTSGGRDRVSGPGPSETSTRPPRYDSHLGKLDDEELRQLTATDLAHSHSQRADQPVPFGEALVSAAARCMQCACGKKADCVLREYAHTYEINRDHYKTGARKRVARTLYASGLVHEPGKCIDCGRCVGVSAAEKSRPGLAFVNRGFDVTVKAPFGADLDTAMGRSLDRCVAACPVGALWRTKPPSSAGLC